MQCYHCGKDTPLGDVYCVKCGSRLGFTRELIAAAIAGEDAAVSFLYNTTYNNVYQAIRPLIKDEDTALDILQDTYIKAFSSLRQLEKPEQFRAWTKRIATNKSKDWLKKRKPALFSELSPEEDGEEPDFYEERISALPDAALDKEETKRLLWEIIDSLSDDQRLVVSMYYFQEMQVKEIAADLGISENTVKSRLNYARKSIETKVLQLEKQGTRLYSLAPLPFLLWLFRSGTETTSAAALSKIVSALGISGGAAAASTAGTATGVTTGTATGTATGAAATTTAAAPGAAAGAAATGIGVGAKIAAVIAAAALIVGGVIVATSVLNNEKQEPQRPVITETDFTPTPEPDTTREPEPDFTPEPEAVPEPEPDLEAQNADRIAAYVSYVEGIDDSDYYWCAYLLYDMDGDGLDELLMIADPASGSFQSYVFTVDTRGGVAELFFSSDPASGDRASADFVMLNYKGKEYLALNYFSGYTDSANYMTEAHNYANFKIMEIKGNELEVVYEIEYRSVYNLELERMTSEAATINSSPMNNAEFTSMSDSIEPVIGSFSDLGMSKNEFLSAYRN